METDGKLMRARAAAMPARSGFDHRRAASERGGSCSYNVNAISLTTAPGSRMLPTLRER